MKGGPYLSPLEKFNSKWIKNLKVRPEYLKLLEEKINKKYTSICKHKKEHSE